MLHKSGPQFIDLVGTLLFLNFSLHELLMFIRVSYKMIFGKKNHTDGDTTPFLPVLNYHCFK
jgi:hypothetical protein